MDAAAAKAHVRGCLSSVVVKCWLRISILLVSRWRERGYQAAALTSRELKDLGLSHSDLPAIASGLLTQDASRRQR